MRLIEASFPAEFRDQVTTAIAGVKPIDSRVQESRSGDSCTARVVIASGEAQPLVDMLQSILAEREDWRIVVLPVEATAPQVDEEVRADKARRSTTALREEIYEDVNAGAKLGPDFLVLTILSAVVAGIGLNADNVAVVIGAMVIAPLLGPILAFSFAGALGDLQLMAKAVRSGLAGIGIVVGISLLLGLLVPVNLASRELSSRADLGLDSLALALASGAAAALSLVTGLSSALVGVMVAVALAPPAVAVGLFAGAGELGLAGRAAMLLATNVVCVNLAAQAVYAWKGVRPRTWLERKSANRSVRINVAVWLVLLIALTALVIALKG